MIPVNIVDGPHKGKVGQLLGYAIEPSYVWPGTENLVPTEHWLLLLVMGAETAFVTAKVSEVEVLIPEPVVGDPAAIAPDSKVLRLGKGDGA